MIELETQRWLLHVARSALRDAFIERWGPEHDLPMPRAMERPDDPRLEEPSRVFVTWRQGEELVGCIGTVLPREQLERAVAHYSTLAALNDPRTPTPHPSTWGRLRCSISVLTAPEPIDAVGLRAIAEAITPFRDGVAIQVGSKRALLLPSVWESLPERGAFVLALAQKAGIHPESEGHAVTAEIFRAEKFGEENPG